MTEDQIERRVEKMVDRADAAFMRGNMTQLEYNERMQAITRWAENELLVARVRHA